MDLNNYKHKGELVGFPKEVIAKMLEHQKEQTGVANITVFEENISADAKDCGFTWSVTPEGGKFWNTVLGRDFEEFFKRYPREYREVKTNLRDYKQKEGLEDFPREVIYKMLENQILQGNVEDITVFERNPEKGMNGGGFTWDRSPEGRIFWVKVIQYKEFGTFFAKYPDIRI